MQEERSTAVDRENQGLSDAEIVTRFLARDEDAIGQTRIKYGKLYMHVARSILGCDEDAEECLNDTLYRMWCSIPPEKPVSLSAYGCRIARNLSLDLLDKKRVRAHELLDELNDALPQKETAEVYEEQQLAASIDAFVRALEHDDRVLFVRRYFCGQSLRELAAHFSASQPKIKSRLYRLRQQLKKHLEKEGFSL